MGLQSYQYLRSRVQKVEVSTSSLLSLFNFQLVLKPQICYIKAQDFSMFSSYMSISVWLISSLSLWIMFQIHIIYVRGGIFQTQFPSTILTFALGTFSICVREWKIWSRSYTQLDNPFTSCFYIAVGSNNSLSLQKHATSSQSFVLKLVPYFTITSTIVSYFNFQPLKNQPPSPVLFIKRSS